MKGWKVKQTPGVKINKSEKKLEKSRVYFKIFRNYDDKDKDEKSDDVFNRTEVTWEQSDILCQ
jgi:hypothetical protein